MASGRTTGPTLTEVDVTLAARVWLRYLYMAAWMALIFCTSHTPDLKAVPLGQRFGLLPEALVELGGGWLEFVVRKSAHVLAFGTMALLARYALAGHFPRLSSRRVAACAFLMAVAYAVFDEWHQSFVPGREGRLRDILIDAAGAAVALRLVGMHPTRYTE